MTRYLPQPKFDATGKTLKALANEPLTVLIIREDMAMVEGSICTFHVKTVELLDSPTHIEHVEPEPVEVIARTVTRTTKIIKEQGKLF